MLDNARGGNLIERLEHVLNDLRQAGWQVDGAESGKEAKRDAQNDVGAEHAQVPWTTRSQRECLHLG